MIKPEFVYETHARTVPEWNFWEQVRRTRNGKPFDEAQILMIVDRCREHLELHPKDRFVDLCCGNGALTVRVFEGTAGGVGVDISGTLTGVARKHFTIPGVTYEEADVVDWVLRTPTGLEGTKALLYGSINFLPPERVPLLLRGVRERFSAIERFVIGNIADRDRLHNFVSPDAYVPGVEDDPASPIGYWWSRDAFNRVAREAGWQTEFNVMPEGYIARHYRFDVVLRRD